MSVETARQQQYESPLAVTDLAAAESAALFEPALGELDDDISVIVRIKALEDERLEAPNFTIETRSHTHSERAKTMSFQEAIAPGGCGGLRAIAQTLGKEIAKRQYEASLPAVRQGGRAKLVMPPPMAKAPPPKSPVQAAPAERQVSEVAMEVRAAPVRGPALGKRKVEAPPQRSETPMLTTETSPTNSLATDHKLSLYAQDRYASPQDIELVSTLAGFSLQLLRDISPADPDRTEGAFSPELQPKIIIGMPEQYDPSDEGHGLDDVIEAVTGVPSAVMLAELLVLDAMHEGSGLEIAVSDKFEGANITFDSARPPELIRAYVPEEALSLDTLQSHVDVVPLEQVLAELAVYLEQTLDEPEAREVRAWVHELNLVLGQDVRSAEWMGLTKPKLNQETLNTILALLLALGYEKPHEALYAFVARHGLSQLIKAMAYICSLDAEAIAVEANITHKATALVLSTSDAFARVWAIGSAICYFAINPRLYVAELQAS